MDFSKEVLQEERKRLQMIIFENAFAYQYIKEKNADLFDADAEAIEEQIAIVEGEVRKLEHTSDSKFKEDFPEEADIRTAKISRLKTKRIDLDQKFQNRQAIEQQMAGFLDRVYQAHWQLDGFDFHKRIGGIVELAKQENEKKLKERLNHN